MRTIVPGGVDPLSYERLQRYCAERGVRAPAQAVFVLLLRLADPRTGIVEELTWRRLVSEAGLGDAARRSLPPKVRALALVGLIALAEPTNGSPGRALIRDWDVLRPVAAKARDGGTTGVPLPRDAERATGVPRGYHTRATLDPTFEWRDDELDVAPISLDSKDSKALAADAAGHCPGQGGSAKVTEIDPVKGVAHRLAGLAFEQPLRPVTRGGFPAVMARLEQALRAGYTEEELARAIESGPVTWTADGLTTALAMGRRQCRGPGEARSTTATALRMIREG